MTLVVDASVAIKWFIREPGHEAALTLFDKDELIAPDLLVSEVLNVAAKKVRRREIASETAWDIQRNITSGLPALYHSADFSADALRLALSLNHDIYDCLYLAVAELTGSGLITADRRFADKVLHLLPNMAIDVLER